MAMLTIILAASLATCDTAPIDPKTTWADGYSVVAVGPGKQLSGLDELGEEVFAEISGDQAAALLEAERIPAGSRHYLARIGYISLEPTLGGPLAGLALGVNVTADNVAYVATARLTDGNAVSEAAVVLSANGPIVKVVSRCMSVR